MTIPYQSTLHSIFLIAHKHKLNLRTFIEGFIEAWKNKTHHDKDLKISCRAENRDSATFLITNEEQVVAQFPVELYFLRNPNLFRNEIQYLHTTNSLKRKRKKKRRNISELRYGM